MDNDKEAKLERYRELSPSFTGTVMISSLNLIVSQYLEQLLEPPIFHAINYHLRRLTGSDFSETASKPIIIDRGLQQIFGKGEKYIVRAALFAAFRAAKQVPDRDYMSLYEGFQQLYFRTRFMD